MKCCRKWIVPLLSLACGIALGVGLTSFHRAAAETRQTSTSNSPGGVIQFDAKEVAAAFEKGRMIHTTGEYKIMAGHRDKGGIPEVHDADTDIFYILDGEATFVTGGKVLDPKTESAGETRGSRINGGDSHRLVKGDVIVIPRGLPHWFSEVPKMVNYFVVKVSAEAKTK
jgi:quercetin dioxygenase-like cupin family protein